MRVDLAKWHMRNMLPLPSGQPAVRPGLRQVYTAESGREIVAGFTVRNPHTQAVWHYIVDVATSGAYDTTIRIYDENFVVQQSHQTHSNVKPRVVTHAEVAEQLLICSPDFPTAWGWIGTGIVRAKSEASVNPTLTALDVPRGVCVGWNDRAVIADGRLVHFSDAGSPRTYVSDSIIPRPGVVFGLHVAAGGALVVAGRHGIEALPEEASVATGGNVQGIFSRPDEEMISAYQTTAAVRGEIWGLTKKGMRRLYPSSPTEVFLDEPVMTRQFHTRVASEDYQEEGRIFEGERGPYVALRNNLHVVDLGSGLRSWWDAPNEASFEVVGLLEEQNGDEIILTSLGGHRVYGNFDGDEALTSEGGTAVRGGVLGRVETSPADSLVCRHVSLASDTGGQIHATIRTSTQSATPTQEAPVIGTAVWSGGDTMISPAMQSAQMDFSVRGDEQAFELLVDQPTSRFDLVADIEHDGPGKRRP